MYASEWRGSLFIQEMTKAYVECPAVLQWATFTILQRTTEAL